MRRRRRSVEDDVDVDIGLVVVSLTDVPASLLRHGVVEGEDDRVGGDQGISHILWAVRPQPGDPAGGRTGGEAAVQLY